MSKIFLVAGLGFGDEGKGTITEYLAAREKAHTVVRYNGGAQAAHNVVLSNGKQHTFSQFGCGTFQGARTHLSRFVITNPLHIGAEAHHLKELGIHNPYDLLTIEEDALVVTPYHVGTNRIKELLRQRHNFSGRHGSCGMGIGETVSDSLKYPNHSIRVKDLKPENLSGLLGKLRFIQEKKFEEFLEVNLGNSLEMKSAIAYLNQPVRDVAKGLIHSAVDINIVSNDYSKELIDKNKDHAFVFEGAQGVLLDELWGFHPYTTWSNTTFNNAFDILPNDSNLEITKIGIIRTYLTRHGAGPFPTEDSNLLNRDVHNKEHAWQGKMRCGHIDMILLRYAIDILGGIDYLAVTHMDRSTDNLKIAVSYETMFHTDLKQFMDSSSRIKIPEKTTIEDQQKLGAILARFSGRLCYWPMDTHFIDILETLLKLPVGIISAGPTVEDKADHI